MQSSRDDAYRRFDPMVAGTDPASMGKRSDDTDGAVAAHPEVSDVVEEDNSGGAAFVEGLTEERTDDHVGSARLIDNGSAEIIVSAAKALSPLGESAVSEIRSPAENETRGLAGRVRVDNRDAAWRCG